MQFLTLVVFVCVVLVAIFLPRFGVVSAFRRRSAARDRELVEDALKHLMDREQQGRAASSESLAGSLNLPRQHAMRLILLMETQGLLESRGSSIVLTSDGERWALHVVRAHRLWERFLADEARMPLSRVHQEAQRREHGSTLAELDRMDAAMGHPVQDPHGDPIPTRDGPRAALRNEPLTDWKIGEPGVIVHLEDEPSIAFDQILAAGIRLGQTIRVLERNPRQIVLSDGEQEYRLAPAVASNVYVTSISESDQLRRTAVPLTEIELGQRVEVVMLDEALQGFTRRRFLDLGLTPGTRVEPELGTFFGDPRGYRVRGTLIALRREQAEAIWVRPLREGARIADGVPIKPHVKVGR
jgi:DtxR family Mn-dependent transcriptional regulator